MPKLKVFRTTSGFHDSYVAREALDEEAKLLDDKRCMLQRKHEAEVEKQRARRDTAAKAYKEMVKAWQAKTE